MRPSFRPAALAALLLAGAGALSQQALAQPRPPAPDTPADAAGAMPVLDGRVQRWLVNPNGDVDGLLLSDGTQVAFPPHLSLQAQQMLRPGDAVRVAGWRTPDAPVVRAASLTTADGRSLADTPASAVPPPPREAASLAAMSASGRIARLLHTGRGDVNGVILDDGLIVRFPPHVGEDMAQLLRPGATIAARGWGSRGPQGGAFEATAIGSSAADMRDIFAGPGREPRGPGARAPGRPGAEAPRPAWRGGAVPPPPGTVSDARGPMPAPMLPPARQ